MLLAAFVIDTAIAVVDAFTAIVLINLVVVGPLLAATRVGPRRTALIALYAFALAVYEGVPHGILGTPDHVVRCTGIALTGGLAVWGAWVRERGEVIRNQAALVAEAGSVLNATLDDAQIARAISTLAVPQLGACCAVHTFDRRGAVRSVAVTHVDGDDAPLAQALRAAWPPATGAPAAGEAAPGEPTAGLLGAIRAIADDGGEAVRSPGAVLVVPMVAHGRTFGALTLFASPSRPAVGDSERRVAHDLAERCATALDTAEQYRARSHVAGVLQDSLLPSRLPRVPGFEIGARFHAGDDIEVGGDFFDVFDTDDGWAAVIGDVSGKGAAAAAVTALARYTVRAVAGDGREPSAVLRALNDALLRQDLGERFCTAAYALVRTAADGATVRLCSAGHPPAYVVRADGGVVPVASRGMALGIVPDPPLATAEIALAPGEKLVLYTDGVIEARYRSQMLGLDGLTRVLAASTHDDAVRTGERVYRAAASASADNDDIAVIVIRRSADEPGNEGLARTGSSGRRGVLQLRLARGPTAPWAARRAIDALEIPVLAPADAHRARLLVSEIVSNSVRHMAGTDEGWIAFDADLTPDRLSVEVRISGPGFHLDAREPPEDEASRQGLVLVDRLADRWGTREDGRCVWFQIDRTAEVGAQRVPRPRLRAHTAAWKRLSTPIWR